MSSYKILFQGDSITDGNRGRNEDPNHILGHSYAYIAAAKLAFEYPQKNLNFINKGVSGNTAADLYARWQKDALNLRPDAISILIGVNDTAEEANSPESLVYHRFDATLKLILDQTKEILPNTKIILMEPFMLDTGNLDRNIYERRVALLKEKQLSVKEIASNYGAIFVPLQERFNKASEIRPASYWIWDSVHPTYAGHGLIADAWLQDTAELFRCLQ